MIFWNSIYLVFDEVNEIESDVSFKSQTTHNSDSEGENLKREVHPTKGIKRRFTNINQKWIRVNVFIFLIKKTFKDLILVAVNLFEIALSKLKRTQ